MKNKLTRLVCALAAVTCLPAFATVTTLDPVTDCDTFNQQGALIAVHEAGWEYGSVYEAMATQHPSVHFYQILIDDPNPSQTICGRSMDTTEPAVFLDGQSISEDQLESQFPVRDDKDDFSGINDIISNK